LPRNHPRRRPITRNRQTMMDRRVARAPKRSAPG